SPSVRHPDYPLLIPASIARLWLNWGADSVPAPAIVACCFTLASVAAVAVGIRQLRRRLQGVLAGLVILGNVAFLLSGILQHYADVPIGFYFASALLLLAIHDSNPRSTSVTLVLAGAMAGLSAWTKNEGWMFVVALLLGRAVERQWQAG